MKLSVAEAAQKLGITKEAVYNRLRRGTLKCEDENGRKMVIFNTQDVPQKLPADDDFKQFLISQIEELKTKNANLHDKIDTMQAQKEDIIIKFTGEINEIYARRNEKLKEVLVALQKPLLARQNGEYLAPIDVEFEEIKSKWVSMSSLLPNLGKKKAIKLQKKILKKMKNSKFVRLENGVILINSKKFGVKIK